MAEYLIQGETLTGIADKIRPLLGLTGTMTPEQMQTNLTTEQSNITAALAALAEKGVEVPEGANSNALAGLIAAIEAGGGGMKMGIITPTESTQTMTIEHGYGSQDYNLFMMAAIDNINSYAKAISTVSALRYNTSSSYASLLFEYGASAKGTPATMSGGPFGQLTKSYSGIDADKIELYTNLGVYPLNSSYTDVVFKAGLRYVWLVAKI